MFEKYFALNSAMPTLPHSFVAKINTFLLLFLQNYFILQVKTILPKKKRLLGNHFTDTWNLKKKCKKVIKTETYAYVQTYLYVCINSICALNAFKTTAHTYTLCSKSETAELRLRKWTLDLYLFYNNFYYVFYF